MFPWFTAWICASRFCTIILITTYYYFCYYYRHFSNHVQRKLVYPQIVALAISLVLFPWMATGCLVKSCPLMSVISIRMLYVFKDGANHVSKHVLRPLLHTVYCVCGGSAHCLHYLGCHGSGCHITAGCHGIRYHSTAAMVSWVRTIVSTPMHCFDECIFDLHRLITDIQ